MTAAISIDNQTLVRSLYEDAINQGRLERAAQFLADDFSASPGERGGAEFIEGVAALRRGFPDVRFVIEDLFGAGDRVALRWSFEAVHQGAFAGVAPTGLRVTQTGTVIFQLAHGKIRRAWIQIDRLGLLQQIGAAPA